MSRAQQDGASNVAGPSFSDVAVGDRLPSLDVPITRTLIISGALASRDYQDVHHDPVLAKARGSRDIFMNILTTNGLVGRYVTDWSGPRSRLSEINIRLGVPNYPDCIMTLTGSVTEMEPLVGGASGEPGASGEDGEDGVAGVAGADGVAGVVTVAIRGTNDLGDHVTGTVKVVLPAPAAALQAPTEAESRSASGS